MEDKNRNEASTSRSTLDTIKEALFAKVRPSEKLGAYIQGVLLNRQWTLEDLADKLGHQTTLLLHALVNGQMPEEAIDDDFIEDLGRVIERSPNVIRVILGRKPKEGTRLHTLLSEQEQQSDEMIETLLEVLPTRYEPHIDNNIHRSKQYDFVIRQLEKFIVRQKRELDAAKRLVKQLQEDTPDESMKLDLQRIIYRIITDEPEAEVRESEVITPHSRNDKNSKS
ncbi:MAG: hypothetical protein Q9P01_01215 [Anaerolineae bacterium]|nr:hypothetical protein [Anaerolineae bacterium]MDQ7033483.1 hypothetical protein [Anaerolineae bacterium]